MIHFIFPSIYEYPFVGGPTISAENVIHESPAILVVGNWLTKYLFVFVIESFLGWKIYVIMTCECKYTLFYYLNNKLFCDPSGFLCGVSY